MQSYHYLAKIQAETLYFVMRDKTLEVKEGLFYSADAAYFILKNFLVLSNNTVILI